MASALTCVKPQSATRIPHYLHLDRRTENPVEGEEVRRHDPLDVCPELEERWQRCKGVANPHGQRPEFVILVEGRLGRSSLIRLVQFLVVVACVAHAGFLADDVGLRGGTSAGGLGLPVGFAESGTETFARCLAVVVDQLGGERLAPKVDCGD